MEKVIEYGNGLKLIVEHIASFRSVTAGFWVNAGSSKEKEENNGISHFIEHMIFKGTDKLSAFEIANAFERIGASVNAFTGKEYTCYYVRSIDEYAEQCIAVMSDIFFESSFLKEELDKERKVILEEINMVEDSPEEICYDLAAKTIFGTHPLSRTILGPGENVKKFQKQDILAYQADHYGPKNVVISMAGNITLAEADRLVRMYILPKMSDRKCSEQKQQPHTITGGYNERIKDFEQANIAISYPSVPFNDEQSATQSVLHILLGGGMSSRMFQRIREQLGLAYSVYTSPSAFAANGVFNIYLNISAENTEKVLEATRDELIRLLKDGIYEEEFLRAKAQLKAACVFSQESLQTMMTSMGKLLLLSNEVFDIDQRIRQFEQVTMDQVNAFAHRTFSSPDFCIAYVGKQTAVNMRAAMKM